MIKRRGKGSKCIDCGNRISPGALRCRRCALTAQLSKGAIIDPMDDEMEKYMNAVIQQRAASLRSLNHCPDDSPEAERAVRERMGV